MFLAQHLCYIHEEIFFTLYYLNDVIVYTIKNILLIY